LGRAGRDFASARPGIQTSRPSPERVPGVVGDAAIRWASFRRPVPGGGPFSTDHVFIVATRRGPRSHNPECGASLDVPWRVTLETVGGPGR
jgi:hypothetical protein